ncbi:MAG: hypothetical protein IKS35_04030, partial [Clostridia bacterium]|nr:hypothetical protein [Clostridia bacterium]
GYQLQYPGVNSWANAYRGNVVTEPEKDTNQEATDAFKAAYLSKANLNTGNGSAPEAVLTTPVDLSKATKLTLTIKFDEVVDLSTLTGNGQCELSSSGKCDQLENHWDFVNKLKGLTMDPETKTVTMVLNFSEANNGGNPDGKNWDLSAINFIRVYHVGQDSGAAKVGYAITDLKFE